MTLPVNSRINPQSVSRSAFLDCSASARRATARSSLSRRICASGAAARFPRRNDPLKQFDRRLTQRRRRRNEASCAPASSTARARRSLAQASSAASARAARTPRRSSASVSRPNSSSVGNSLRNSRPGVGLIGVGGVVEEWVARGVADADQRRFPYVEQGPQQAQRAKSRDRRHAGKTRDAGAPRQAEENRFGLIVGVMGGDDGAGADGARAIRKQAVARLTRPLLDAGRGLFARPGQQMMRKTQRPRPSADLFRPPLVSSDRRPWSTVATAMSCAARSDQFAQSSISATESGPPETASSKRVMRRQQIEGAFERQASRAPRRVSIAISCFRAAPRRGCAPPSRDISRRSR